MPDVDSMKDAISLNVAGVDQLVSSRLNKSNNGALSDTEGVAGDIIDALELPMADEELLALADKWEVNYSPYESKIRSRQEINKTYYLGRQQSGSPLDITDAPIAGNQLFPALETFLPAALAKNPEPVVWADNTPEGNDLASDVKTMLQYHADVLVLRAKLALMVRKWSVDFLGVLKHGWDNEIGDIKLDVRNVRNFIFDPAGYVDVYGDMKGYIGERITLQAKDLIQRFPKHEEYISMVVQDKLGTEVTYTEWWEDDYYFCTFKRIILDKGKNYFFNYPKTTIGPDGQPIEEPGQNHFAKPKKPYTFFSVFSFADQPHDNTGLIEQNIPNQNRYSRRLTQIDTNLQNGNNGLALSADNFNQQTGKQAASARRRGSPILVPSGRPVAEAIVTLPSPSIPDAFFKASDQDALNIRGSFGTEGITSQEPDADQTARGMILQQQFDNSRIGGGIGDKLAQVADNVFNWWVQLYYLFYDEPHFAAIMGQMKSTEYVILRSQNLNRKLVVSVGADSMKPKDELTTMNQAIQLWEAKAIDIKSLLVTLNFPNPEETAGMAMLQQLNPQLYMQLAFPQLGQEVQQATQPQQMGEQGAQAPPEQGTPPPSLSSEPASSQLSNVPLPPV